MSLAALRDAFITPLEPEDLFALASGIDWILDYAVDLVSEAEVMASGPDGGVAEMAGHLAEAMRRHRRRDRAARVAMASGAIEAADAAIEAERALERAYYRGMAALLEESDMRERIARRELYRRCFAHRRARHRRRRAGDLRRDEGELRSTRSASL